VKRDLAVLGVFLPLEPEIKKRALHVLLAVCSSIINPLLPSCDPTASNTIRRPNELVAAASFAVTLLP